MYSSFFCQRTIVRVREYILYSWPSGSRFQHSPARPRPWVLHEPTPWSSIVRVQRESIFCIAGHEDPATSTAQPGHDHEYSMNPHQRRVLSGVREYSLYTWPSGSRCQHSPARPRPWVLHESAPGARSLTQLELWSAKSKDHRLISRDRLAKYSTLFFSKEWTFCRYFFVKHLPLFSEVYLSKSEDSKNFNVIFFNNKTKQHWLYKFTGFPIISTLIHKKAPNSI